MEDLDLPEPLVARCIVCRGNIHQGDAYEQWDGGFYCEKHSLPHLRQRAREYAAKLADESWAEQHR